MRAIISEPPFLPGDAAISWYRRGVWPCNWISCPEAGDPPFACAYAVRFDVPEPATVRIHVSADERYTLFLDGRRLGAGPERGDPDHWFFETYDLHLAAGAHVLAAQVWSLGVLAPFAQTSVRHGFLVFPEDEWAQGVIGTGKAAWMSKRLGGYEFLSPGAAWGTGARVRIDGSQFDWGFEEGLGEGWEEAVAAGRAVEARWRNEDGPTRLLRPATLPSMLDEVRELGRVRVVAPLETLATREIPIRLADDIPNEHQEWQLLLEGQSTVRIPPHTRRRILIDLENYYCAYPEITVSGGAGSLIRMHWQEGLYLPSETLHDESRPRSKGNRDEVDGKNFLGVGDEFLLDGGQGRRFTTLWWECGRYVDTVVETADEPLLIESIVWRETRYPMEMEGGFEASDPRLTGLVPLAVRAVQMCSHETYMDCPWYEQLMYIGDTRLEALTTFVMTRDDRLPRKALSIFAASLLDSGITQSRYPSHVRQIIPPFSLWWVSMLHDYALWRGDLPFIKSLMTVARSVVDTYISLLGDDGLVRSPYGWNFVDWVRDAPGYVGPDKFEGGYWFWGMPQGSDIGGVSGVQNWHLALVLRQMADLENWLGEPELSARATRLADSITAASLAHFWDEEKGLIADDLDHQWWSEHSQCLALLGGGLPADIASRAGEGLLSYPLPARTTIYFTHYLFETYAQLGKPDALLDRLALWYELQGLGLKTTVEMPEPSRSDCHAWGAHPLYHFYASLLGIRPAAPGFVRTRIAPQMGALTEMSGALPHPNGFIKVCLRREGAHLHATVELPEGVEGEFAWGSHRRPLAPGAHALTFD